MMDYRKPISVVTIALFVSGCLFDTRDAEAPEPTSQCASLALDTPDKVFQAMRCSIEERRDAAYERVISQAFVFSPTEQDSLDQTFAGTAVYANWTKTVEMDVLRLLFGDAQALAVDFATSQLINQTTFVRYRVEYVLEVVSAGPDTTTYAGVAQFDVRNEGGNWRLTFWDEVDTVPNVSTWGYLKGILRLRLNP